MADAEATITGVYPNQKLNLKIPQGPQGPVGPPGPSLPPSFETTPARLVDPKDILNDTTNRLGGSDGVEFFTVLDVRGRVTNPIAPFYAYVAGHDSTSIWLVTASDPAGPWTWRQSIKTAAASLLVNGHISSPEAIWWNGKIHLYYHGMLKTATGQPTVVATSTNGINFTDHTRVAIPTTMTEDTTRYYATSTGYARIANTGGALAAVFQANNIHQNSMTSSVTTSIGLATSTTGLDWQVSRAPLITNLPGENGPFSPGIARVGSIWWVWAFFPSRGTVDLYGSYQLEPGTFNKLGTWFSAPTGFDNVDAATIVWLDGAPHLYYGVKNLTTFSESRVYHSRLDWVTQ